MGVKHPMETRFWKRVQRGPGCWLWTGARQVAGYGEFHVDQHTRSLAHRVMWELAHGSPPGDGVVCHKCDNPSCVNPDHLFLGTQADNVRDMMEKGRGPTGDRNGLRKNPLAVAGERNHQAKLTWAAVDAIRANTVPARELAAKYGVSETTIWDARSGRTWGKRP